MSEASGNSGREILPADRARALELIGMLRSTIYSDDEHAEFDQELQRLVPHPAWSDLLFWHEPDLSDEEALEEALRYRPIEL